MTEKNIEYQSLHQCANDLTQLIQHNVVSVSSKLFAKGLVAKDVHDSVLSVDGASNQSKAAKLLSCVFDKIKESSDQCQNFVDVLGEDSYFDIIVLKIAKVRGKHNLIPSHHGHNNNNGLFYYNIMTIHRYGGAIWAF